MQNKKNINNNNNIDKEEEVLNINSNDIFTGSNDEILLKYKIDNDKPKIRIFGHTFFNNNKDKLSFICENKSYELNEFFSLSDLNEEKEFLEIHLKGIKNVVNWSNMFKDCSLLLSIKDNYSMDNIDVTDMSYMFSRCSKLENIDIHCKTNKVTNMSSMFSCCSSLITLPDISKWNIDNVTDMSSMFCSCSSLKTLPDISKWNTKNVTTMCNMFCSCTSLTKLPDISNWNTNNVNNMSCMFYNCKSLLSLPDISKWNTKKANTMQMFYGCE